MLQSKSDFIKISVIYLLKFIIILFINPYLSGVLSLAVFIAVPGISSTVYVNLINGICGGIIELILLFFVFYPEFYNNRKSEFKAVSLYFVTALAAQLIIASVNYFYPYTAGMAVTYISYFWYITSTGIYPNIPNDIPAHYYVIMTLAVDILRIAVVLLALTIAKRKQLKEKTEILGKNNGT
jgi:hypothetical protein